MPKSNWFYPQITDLESAREASHQGVWACAAVAGVTLLFYGLTHFNINPLRLTSYALIDSALFLLLGVGIYRKSRTAAVLGLALYVLERIFGSIEYGFKGSAVLVLVVIAFVNSVRGTFAYRKYLETASNPPEPALHPDTHEPQEQSGLGESEYLCSACGAGIAFGQPVCPSCGERLDYD